MAHRRYLIATVSTSALWSPPASPSVSSGLACQTQLRLLRRTAAHQASLSGRIIPHSASPLCSPQPTPYPPQALGTSLSQFPSLLDVSHFFQKCFYGVSCVCLHKNCCVAMVPVASREAVKLCLMVDPQWFWIKPPTFCSSL